MTESKFCDLWVSVMARPESFFSWSPGQLISYPGLGFLDHLKEGFGEMGLVVPVSKPQMLISALALTSYM